MLDLHSILEVAVKGGASDVHLKTGLPPLFRINGGLVPLRNGDRLTPTAIRGLLTTMASQEQLNQLEHKRELDFAYTGPGVGRFRVNAFFQRQHIGLVLRVISADVKSLDELGMPDVLKQIVGEHRGLVLVTGATGSGKSTTLAALINEINSQRTAHIVTIEDPVEFLFRDKRSVINQREVGHDTLNFANALRASLRQDPDVILVGEMRDPETIETAMTAAETGHLVLSTLHTIDAAETVNRIVGMFPPYQHPQIRHALATSLRAIISQRLVKRADGRGRVAAMEVLVSTGRVRELLEAEGMVHELRGVIAQGSTNYGMQTFDQSLMALVRQGRIETEEALDHCTNRDDFLLRLAGIQSQSDQSWTD